MKSGGSVFKFFSPFYEKFSEKILQYVELSFLLNIDWEEPPSTEAMIKGAEKEVLTMDHLEVAFIACLTPMGLATAVFLMELTVHALCNKKGISSKPQEKRQTKAIAENSEPLSLMDLDKDECWKKYWHESTKRQKYKGSQPYRALSS